MPSSLMNGSPSASDFRQNSRIGFRSSVPSSTP